MTEASLAVDARPAAVPVTRIIHTIHATLDITACRQLYFDAFGGLMFAQGYHPVEDRDMALIYVTDHMVEPMAPRDAGRDDKTFARYLKKYGQSWHSFELKVPDARAAAAACKARGVVLTTEYPHFFFTHPKSTGGIVVEVCEILMKNDPQDRGHWNPDWARGHVSGLTRLNQIACLSRDMDASVTFLTEGLAGGKLADERIDAPQPGRRVSVRLGQDLLTITQPDDLESGPLGGFMARPNAGIYALVWNVEDLDKAQGHFHGMGLRTTTEGCIAGAFAIEPEDFQGARHEFVQG